MARRLASRVALRRLFLSVTFTFVQRARHWRQIRWNLRHFAAAAERKNCLRHRFDDMIIRCARAGAVFSKFRPPAESRVEKKEVRSFSIRDAILLRFARKGARGSPIGRLARERAVMTAGIKSNNRADDGHALDWLRALSQFEAHSRARASILNTSHRAAISGR